VELDQDEAHASYEGWCRAAEARINWHAHIDAIHNLVRGCDPTPGAWTTVNGTKVQMFGSRKHPARRFGDVEGGPGQVVLIDDQGIHVAAQGGTVEIMKARPAGGEKTSAAVVAKSLDLVEGAQLGSPPS
jgi:methionyl-tRNA formyltransferase